MATNNSIDNASSQLTVDPGAAGDSFVQFDINATGEFRIGVDDTDDSFRISQGSALGTSDTFVMSASGERTMPLQPTFFAYVGATKSNVTGDGTTYTVAFDTELWDIGSDFNTSTFTYTFPVTGKYYLCCGLTTQDSTTSHTRQTFTIVATGINIQLCDVDPGNVREANSGSENLTIGNSTMVDMTAADTATVTIQTSGSTKVIDILGDGTGSATSSFFCGYLLV